jgi:hypothetical protein
LAEKSIQTWFDMQIAFTENFEGTYKRPHNIGDLQRCRRADGETSQTFLARCLDMKNSYEGVTNESTILAFIDSLKIGQQLHHRLLRERNKGKLNLNYMISIASNYTATNDDARESLKASAIQNNGKRNINKRKSPPEEHHNSDMVATTFSEKGQNGQCGRGHGTSDSQPRSSIAPATAPAAAVSYDEYRDMPCFAHRDAAGKCSYTNRNCKFVNDIKADQEAGYKRTRRPRPRGKGKSDKDNKSKDGGDMEEDPAPKPSEKTEAGAGGSNPFKNPKKGAYHTFLGPPTAKAQRAAMRYLKATVPKVHQYVRW